jgi:hypothetical protein
VVSEMLGFQELAKLSGLSEAALRKRRSRGQLPDQDAPGPKWRRESLAEFLKEGAPVPAADRSVPQEARSTDGPSVATPERSAPATAPPVPSQPAFPGEDAEDIRRRAMTIADVLACPHPVQDRKVTGYATICVVCGRRMEGRDRWTGAGYAGWTPALLERCPHPEAERRHHSWGSACGVCGRLLRS